MGAVDTAADNAMMESFWDSFKTELIADRVWRTHSQLELAIVEYVAWFNSSRLHSKLSNYTPDEIEALWHAENAPAPNAPTAGQLTINAIRGEVDDPSGVVSEPRLKTS